MIFNSKQSIFQQLLRSREHQPNFIRNDELNKLGGFLLQNEKWWDEFMERFYLKYYLVNELSLNIRNAAVTLFWEKIVSIKESIIHKV